MCPVLVNADWDIGRSSLRKIGQKRPAINFLAVEPAVFFVDLFFPSLTFRAVRHKVNSILLSIGMPFFLAAAGGKSYLVL